MRRVTVIASLVALLIAALPMSAAIAAPAVADEHVVLLAVDEPAGPEPALRTDEDNAARTLSGYEDNELPFTWGAAWILSFAGLVGLTLMLGLYQLLVRGPAQRQDS